MKKKLLMFVLVLSVALSVSMLCACKGDPKYPRSFRVIFETNVEGFEIPSLKVLEGYHIDKPELENITYPDQSRIAVFCGWYSDNEFNSPWDISKTRVTETETVLYAKWIYPNETPSEIVMGEDAFSTTIKWAQIGINGSTDIKIRLNKGRVQEITTTEDGIYESVNYTPSNWQEVSGTLSYDEETYTVSFNVSDKIAGGLYQAEITTDFGDKTTQIVKNDLRFKGTGTKTDPYLVYSENDLKRLTVRSYESDTYAVLKSDIVLGSVYSEKSGCVYNGKFDGNNKTVTLKNNSGLFFELGENAEVYNLNFKGAISGGNPSIGVVANYNSGYVHHVNSVAVSVKSDGGKVNEIKTLNQGGAGGIVGTNKKTGKISNCTVTSGNANVITGKIGIGGVAGINYGEISNMTMSGIVGAYNGKEISSTIANSFAGCAAGVNYGLVYRVNVDGKINCRRADLSATKDVGATNVGGVVGYNANGGSVKECLFQGMRCVGDTNVGGICGYNDGRIESCFTGRRVRKPSGTTEEERMFISPVIGSYNVGGICGKVGENSVITNVFSTANVWCYGMNGYTVAEKADNAIGINCNQQYRLTSNYLGRTYGEVYSNKLTAPIGENVLILDNTSRVGSVENNLLGAKLNDEGKNTPDTSLIVNYLKNYLGSAFGYNSTYGISLLWQSKNTHPLSYYYSD